jgi:16S rRNA (adenine1518-N6/adenine1519-N6)-dimethyltransferase
MSSRSGPPSGGPGGDPYPRARRSLGQNFLVDPNLRRRIVEEVGATGEDTVLEIGPGQGALTEGLARRAGRLILVELDRELARRLEERYREEPSVSVLQADILEVRLADLVPKPAQLKVVGNIPYNLTTPIIFHLLTPPRPGSILLMVQREVADRILAEPGGRDYGALTIGVRSVASVERVLSVPAGAFRPRPRVESQVIRMLPRDPSPLSPTEEVTLRRLTRAAFQWRRKQLQKILRDHPDLRQAGPRRDELLAAGGVRPRDRPEDMTVEGFCAMARMLAQSEEDAR